MYDETPCQYKGVKHNPKFNQLRKIFPNNLLYNSYIFINEPLENKNKIRAAGGTYGAGPAALISYYGHKANSYILEHTIITNMSNF